MAVVTSARAGAGEPSKRGKPQRKAAPTAQPTQAKPDQAQDGSTSGAAQRAYHRRLARVSPGHAAALRAQARGLPSATAQRIPFVATIIGMLVVGLALTLLLTTKAAETAYQIGAARSENKDLRDQVEALRSQVEVRNAAPALALEASKLGMVPIKDTATLRVSPDGTVTVVGTPSAADGEPLPPFNRVQSDPAAGDEVVAGPASGPAGLELEVAVPLPADQVPVPLDEPNLVLPAPEPAPAAPAPLEPAPLEPAAPIAPADGAAPPPPGAVP